jgi:hypothetical protein
MDLTMLTRTVKTPPQPLLRSLTALWTVWAVHLAVSERLLLHQFGGFYFYFEKLQIDLSTWTFIQNGACSLISLESFAFALTRRGFFFFFCFFGSCVSNLFNILTGTLHQIYANKANLAYALYNDEAPHGSVRDFTLF